MCSEQDTKGSVKLKRHAPEGREQASENRHPDIIYIVVCNFLKWFATYRYDQAGLEFGGRV